MKAPTVNKGSTPMTICTLWTLVSVHATIRQRPSLMSVEKRAVKHRLPYQTLPSNRALKWPVTKNTLEHLSSVGIQTAGIPGIRSYIKAAPSNVHTSDMVYTTVCPTKWV